jgi:hypothetical protein
VLLPNISEWYFLFELLPGGTPVALDILTRQTLLYKGTVGSHFTDRNGKLSGILLGKAQRYDQRTYLRDKDAGKENLNPSEYWRSIPGKNLYILADDIANINIHYQGPIKERIEKQLEKFLDIEELSVEIGDSMELADSAEANLDADS